MKMLVVLTGAGVSAESGVKTFRDHGGLWEGHDVMKVATPEGWRANPDLVLHFYNQRRAQLQDVHPNEAHTLIAQLEYYFDVTVITQNVDDLHERSGSTHVVHLHGELLKARSSGNQRYIKYWPHDITLNDKCPDGYQMRPHIVWFGEEVSLIEKAAQILSEADILLVIGTSLQVYPAANLLNECSYDCSIYYIDQNPASVMGFRHQSRIQTVAEPATIGMKRVFEELTLGK